MRQLQLQWAQGMQKPWQVLTILPQRSCLSAVSYSLPMTSPATFSEPWRRWWKCSMWLNSHLLLGLEELGGSAFAAVHSKEHKLFFVQAAATLESGRQFDTMSIEQNNSSSPSPRAPELPGHCSWPVVYSTRHEFHSGGQVLNSNWKQCVTSAAVSPLLHRGTYCDVGE